MLFELLRLTPYCEMTIWIGYDYWLPYNVVFLGTAATEVADNGGEVGITGTTVGALTGSGLICLAVAGFSTFSTFSTFSFLRDLCLC